MIIAKIFIATMLIMVSITASPNSGGPPTSFAQVKTFAGIYVKKHHKSIESNDMEYAILFAGLYSSDTTYAVYITIFNNRIEESWESELQKHKYTTDQFSAATQEGSTSKISEEIWKLAFVVLIKIVKEFYSNLRNFFEPMVKMYLTYHGQETKEKGIVIADMEELHAIIFKYRDHFYGEWFANRFRDLITSYLDYKQLPDSWIFMISTSNSDKIQANGIFLKAAYGEYDMRVCDLEVRQLQRNAFDVVINVIGGIKERYLTLYLTPQEKAHYRELLEKICKCAPVKFENLIMNAMTGENGSQALTEEKALMKILNEVHSRKGSEYQKLRDRITTQRDSLYLQYSPAPKWWQKCEELLQ